MKKIRNKNEKNYTIESDEDENEASHKDTPRENFFKYTKYEKIEETSEPSPTKDYSQNVLITSGLIGAYENLMTEFCDYGFPHGNVFEFAIASFLKFEKKLKAEKANKFQAERALDAIKKAKLDFEKKVDKIPLDSPKRKRKASTEREYVKVHNRAESLDLDSTSSNSNKKTFKYAQDHHINMENKKLLLPKFREKNQSVDPTRHVDTSSELSNFHRDPRFTKMISLKPEKEAAKFAKFNDSNNKDSKMDFETVSSERRSDFKTSRLVNSEKSHTNNYSISTQHPRNKSMQYLSKTPQGSYPDLSTNEGRYTLELQKRYPEKVLEEQILKYVSKNEQSIRRVKNKSNDMNMRSISEFTPERKDRKGPDDFNSRPSWNGVLKK